MAFGGLKGTLTGNALSIGTSAPLTGSVAVVVGDLVYAAFGEQATPSTTTVSDNLGNTYTATSAATDGGTATGHAYWARVTVAGTLTTITAIANGGTNNFAGVAAVIEGPFLASPLDANPANTTTDLTSPFTCPPTGTLAQTLEVVLAWGVAAGNTVWAATSPNLLANQVASSTVIKTAVGYQLVSATTTVSPEFTAASNPTAIVLGTSSFKGAPPAQGLTPTLFDDSADTFFTPIAAPGAVALTVTLFADADTFFAPDVTQPAASQGLTANLFVDADSFYTITAQASITLTPALFSDADAFYAPATAPGAVDLLAGLFIDGDNIPSAIVAAGAVDLSPALFSDIDTFYGSVVSTGAGSLFAPLFIDSDAFYSPAIAPGSVDLSPALFDDADIFPAALLNTTIDLGASIFVDADAFFVPAVAIPGSGRTLFADTFVDPDLFFAPSSHQYAAYRAALTAAIARSASAAATGAPTDIPATPRLSGGLATPTGGHIAADPRA